MSKPVVIKILGDASSLNKALKKSGAGLKKFGGVAKGVGKFAGLGLLAAGAGAVKLGSEFETMQATLVKGTGATGEALEGLSDQMLRAMGRVPDSGAVVATALADVNTRLALTGDELGDVTEQFLDFSRLTGGDVAASVKGVSDSMALFGVEAGQADEVMGDLLRVSQATGAPVDALTAALQKQGGTLAALGFDLEESTALLGQMSAEGISLRKAGSGIEYFTDQMLAAGKDPRAEWDLLQGAIQGAADETAAATIATEAFGPAGLAMVGGIRSGTLEFGGLLGAGAGLIAEQTAASATFGEKASEMFNRLKAALMPVAGQLMDKLAVGLDKLTVLFADMQPVFVTIVGGFRAFKAALTIGDGDVTSGGFAGFMEKFANYLLFVVWPLVRDIKDWFVENWPQISEVLMTVGKFIVEEVLPRVIKALRFVAEVVRKVVGFIVDHWPEISAAFEAARKFIVEEVIPAVVMAVEWLRDAIELVVGKIQEFWERFGEDILATATRIWGLISEYIGNALEIVRALFATFKALFSGDWDAMWDGILDVVRGLGTQLKLVFTIAWDVFKTSFRLAFEGLKILARVALDLLVDGVKALPGLMKTALVEGVPAMAQAGLDLAQALWDAIEDKVKGIPGMIGGFLKGIGGSVLGAVGIGGDDGAAAAEQAKVDAILAQNVANGIGARANGGPLRPGLTLVGERGPELLDIPNGMGGGSVVANQDMPTGGDVIVNVSSNADPHEIGAAVAWSMRRAG
jgi:hypothetical protein